MNIAGLRVRITIQKNETVVDKYGNHKSAWSDYFSCWATALTSGLSASEKETAGHTTEADKLDITNLYEAEGEIVLEAQKTLKNLPLKKGMFTFELLDATGATIEMKTNDDRLDITVRYSSETAAVNSKEYRVLLEGRIYNILSIDEMGFKRNSRKLHTELTER